MIKEIIEGKVVTKFADPSAPRADEIRRALLSVSVNTYEGFGTMFGPRVGQGKVDGKISGNE